MNNDITFKIKYKHALLTITIIMVMLGLIFGSYLVIFIAGMLAKDTMTEYGDHLMDFISEKKNIIK